LCAGGQETTEKERQAEKGHPWRRWRSVSPQDAGAHIVLTARGDTPRHAGQISLPGGVVEPGETFEQAALREAHEEIALDRDGVRVLGALTPLDIPVSGFRLYPIVAALDRRPHHAAAAREDGAFIGVAMHGLCPP